MPKSEEVLEADGDAGWNNLQCAVCFEYFNNVNSGAVVSATTTMYGSGAASLPQRKLHSK